VIAGILVSITHASGKPLGFGIDVCPSATQEARGFPATLATSGLLRRGVSTPATCGWMATALPFAEACSCATDNDSAPFRPPPNRAAGGRAFCPRSISRRAGAGSPGVRSAL